MASSLTYRRQAAFDEGSVLNLTDLGILFALFLAVLYAMALFPQVTVQHHGESDLDLLTQLAQRLQQLGVPYLLVSDDLAPEELSYLYGRCQVLLGTRLHSCILAACAATPVVAIRYQGFKTEGIMSDSFRWPML